MKGHDDPFARLVALIEDQKPLLEGIRKESTELVRMYPTTAFEPAKTHVREKARLLGHLVEPFAMVHRGGKSRQRATASRSYDCLRNALIA